MNFMIRFLVGCSLLWASVASAETVNVKYRGPVDLKPFTCTDTVSSFVNRICYDKADTYMLILLKNTWYHYCEIGKGTVRRLPPRAQSDTNSVEAKGTADVDAVMPTTIS